MTAPMVATMMCAEQSAAGPDAKPGEEPTTQKGAEHPNDEVPD